MGGRPDVSHGHEERLADRRSLVISAVAMVVLVLVGVVSAAVFTRSACEAIVPDAVASRTAGTDLVAALDDAFPDIDAGDLEDMTTAVTALAGALGPVTAAADVSGADRLAVIDPSTGGIAATGATTTVLEGWGTTVVATADLGDATVVGSGGTLYALALVNDVTGQVDAVRPLDADLGPGSCTDTAVVAEPFAFHLDAADGALLLFRVEEDADDPELELVAAPAGRSWLAGLDVGIAPPGILGERLTGRLGDRLAVVGRRTGQQDDAAVVAAFDRAGGEPRWSVGRDVLGGVLSSDGADVVDVEAVGEDLVVVSVTPEPDPALEGSGDRAVTTLVTLGADDGAVLATDELAPGTILHDVVLDGDRLLSASVAGGATSVQRLRTSGSGMTVSVPDEGRRLGVLPTGQDLLLGERSVSLVARDDAEVTGFMPLVGRDVAVHDGGTTLLFGGPGGGAVVITFGR